MIYLVATQRPWGRETFDRIVDARPTTEQWVLREAPPDNPEGSVTLLSLCERLDPRYVFLLNWSTIVAPGVFDRWEVVNLHCTALPYGRGGHPIENLLLAGHAETVITAHKVVKELDAGPIYANPIRVRTMVDLRRRVSIGGWFDAGTEAQRLVDCAYGLSVYRGVKDGVLDEIVCADDQFDTYDDLSKDEILDRFIEPCAAIIRHIVDSEPTPAPQVGQVVRFSRLSKQAYAEFWERRRSS